MASTPSSLTSSRPVGRPPKTPPSLKDLPPLAARLRTLREKSGLRPTAVAQASGVARGYYSKLEDGQIKRPSDEKLERLAVVLGGDLEELKLLADQSSNGFASLAADSSLGVVLKPLLASMMWATLDHAKTTGLQQAQLAEACSSALQETIRSQLHAAMDDIINEVAGSVAWQLTDSVLEVIKVANDPLDPVTIAAWSEKVARHEPKPASQLSDGTRRSPRSRPKDPRQSDDIPRLEPRM